MSENKSQSRTATPSRAEIIALLNQHKGTVHVWETLTANYGPPKNAWGSFCRLVIREHRASSNATIGTSINGAANAPANAQSNAPNNVAPPNSGSKTANVLEHSTPNVPMVVVREPDAIIHPDDRLPAYAYPDAMDMVNFQQVINDPLYQQLTQSSRVQYQPAQLPPKRNFWEEMNTEMLQTMQYMMQMRLYLTMFRAFFQH
jgi:hypothetical protein